MKLVISDLEKRYGKKEVLRNVSYTFEQGRIYGLLGRNGAGKTTMFSCLGGQVPFEGGQLSIETDNGDLRPLAFDDIGFVFTQPHLPEFMTGYEFIRYFIDINKDKVKRQVDISAEFKKIDFDENDQHKLIREYSHGMKNKVQILAFLILRPLIILLDEPLTSFDVVVQLEIKNLIKSIKGEHIIVFSTHILQLAQDLCDDIVILHEGKLDKVDTTMLHDKSFENQILNLLKEDSNAYV